jgi:hypothetical protein
MRLAMAAEARIAPLACAARATAWAADSRGQSRAVPQRFTRSGPAAIADPLSPGPRVSQGVAMLDLNQELWDTLKASCHKLGTPYIQFGVGLMAIVDGVHMPVRFAEAVRRKWATVAEVAACLAGERMLLCSSGGGSGD